MVIHDSLRSESLLNTIVPILKTGQMLSDHFLIKWGQPQNGDNFWKLQFWLMNSRNGDNMGVNLWNNYSHKLHIWMVSPMNWLNMIIQTWFMVAAVVTYFTFEWLLVPVNWLNMSFQIRFLEQLQSQIVHMNGFSFLWTDSIWFFKLGLW